MYSLLYIIFILYIHVTYVIHVYICGIISCAQSLSHIQLFCDPMNCSLPGSSVNGISQARILEWVASPFSRGSPHPRNWTQADSSPSELWEKPLKAPETNTVWHYLYVDMLSHVQLFATPKMVAHQAPLSTGFPRLEHWSGLPFPSPGDLPDPGLNLHLFCRQADSWPLCHLGSPKIEYQSQFTSLLRDVISPVSATQS